MVRRLAVHRGEPVATTLYVDVDGSRYPRESDYRPHIESLLRHARQQAQARGAGVARAVEDDVGDITAWLATGIRRQRTRGLAFFSCHPQGFFEALPLAVGVRDQLTIAPFFAVTQLCDAMTSTAPALVVMVDRHRSRLVHLVPGALEEGEGPTDESERQADTDLELGSFERRHEEQARVHFRRVADVLADELGRTAAKRVILGGTPEDVAAVHALLAPGVLAVVVGSMALAMTSSLHEIELAALDVLGAVRRHHEEETVDEVSEKAAQHHGAVGGLAPTLEALADQEASTLVVERGMTAAGGWCPQCGFLVPGTGSCPRCGTTPDCLDDVVAMAVTRAFAHHVAVEFCEPGSLGGLEGIGALVRSAPVTIEEE